MKIRPGSSLIILLIFFAAAIMTAARIFFVSDFSFESISEEREVMQAKIILENKIELACEWLKGQASFPRVKASHKNFYKNTMISPDYSEDIAPRISGWNSKNKSVGVGEFFLTVNNLNYELDVGSSFENSTQHEKLFAAMGEGFYLVRAYTRFKTKISLMCQVLVSKDGEAVQRLSYEEIWY